MNPASQSVPSLWRERLARERKVFLTLAQK